MAVPFLEIFSILISQPLSEFYLTKIKAKDLLKISFPETLQYVDEKGKLKGSQRKLNEKRLKEIARYIDSIEMSFPNSIILAANYNKDGEVVEDEEIRWKITKVNENNIYKISIPQSIPLSAIIDGQHRLLAFQYLQKKEREDLEIPCSIFFDLPNSYQAFLFATINGNQVKVDKSLALEQFGFNVEDEPRKSWTPEKLAVYFSRKLNIDLKSPLHQRIKVAPIDNVLFKTKIEDTWQVSTATIVNGILGLISSNPKRDRVEMGQERIFGGRTRNILKDFRDSTPLRNWFIEEKDDEIYQVVVEYLQAVDKILWGSQNVESYIIKTVGIQALFDLLKTILKNNQVVEGINFNKYLKNIANVDFTDNYFQASGTGRMRIRNILLYVNEFKSEDELKKSDLLEIRRLCGDA